MNSRNSHETLGFVPLTMHSISSFSSSTAYTYFGTATTTAAKKKISLQDIPRDSFDNQLTINIEVIRNVAKGARVVSNVLFSSFLNHEFSFLGDDLESSIKFADFPNVLPHFLVINF